MWLSPFGLFNSGKWSPISHWLGGWWTTDSDIIWWRRALPGGWQQSLCWLSYPAIKIRPAGCAVCASKSLDVTKAPKTVPVGSFTRTASSQAICWRSRRYPHQIVTKTLDVIHHVCSGSSIRNWSEVQHNVITCGAAIDWSSLTHQTSSSLWIWHSLSLWIFLLLLCTVLYKVLSQFNPSHTHIMLKVHFNIILFINRSCWFILSGRPTGTQLTSPLRTTRPSFVSLVDLTVILLSQE